MAIQSVTGTWGIGDFKLPDFALTELFNTSTGGNTSDPTWNNPAVYQATIGANQPTQQQAQNTNFWGGFGVGNTPSLTTNTQERNATNSGVLGTSTGSGGSGGGGGTSPGGTYVPPGWSTSDIHEGSRYTDASGNEYTFSGGQWKMTNSYENRVNDVFQPTFNYLNQAEQTLRGAYPAAQQEIEGQYGTAKQSLDTQKASGERDLAAQATAADTRKEDAASAARRLYQELMMGGNQRFGGASSAGQAFTEINAAEQQRRAGDIQKQYAGAMQQIEGYKSSLNEKYTGALADLENQKNSALNDARNEFNNKLLEITRMRSEAESNKASMRLQALLIYVYPF